MRLAPIGIAIGALINFAPSEDYPAAGTGPMSSIAPGTIFPVAPTNAPITTAGVPNWMGGEVMAALNTSSSTFAVGTIVTLDKNFAITAVASTAGLGTPLYVCLSSFTAGNVTTQIGWLMRRGMCPVTFSAAATAGAVYIGTAGNATPSAANGKQILNAITLIAAATTFTRSVTTKNGSAILTMGTNQGFFPGQAITATGTSGLTVSAVGDDGTSVTMSGNATASATVTATLTPTGFGIVYIDNPFAQGQAV